jgi:hypothetical protein
VAHDGSRIEVLPLNGTGAYHLRHLLTLALRRARLFAPRVLVVDDEPAIRDLLIRALGSAGFEVWLSGMGKQVSSGRRRQAALRSGRHQQLHAQPYRGAAHWSPTGDVPRRPHSAPRQSRASPRSTCPVGAYPLQTLQHGRASRGDRPHAFGTATSRPTSGTHVLQEYSTTLRTGH